MKNSTAMFERSVAAPRPQSAFDEARSQFDAAANQLALDAATREFLRADARASLCASYLIAVDRVARACRQRGWV